MNDDSGNNKTSIVDGKPLPKRLVDAMAVDDKVAAEWAIRELRELLSRRSRKYDRVREMVIPRIRALLESPTPEIQSKALEYWLQLERLNVARERMIADSLGAIRLRRPGTPEARVGSIGKASAPTNFKTPTKGLDQECQSLIDEMDYEIWANAARRHPELEGLVDGGVAEGLCEEAGDGPAVDSGPGLGGADTAEAERGSEADSDAGVGAGVAGGAGSAADTEGEEDGG